MVALTTRRRRKKKKKRKEMPCNYGMLPPK